ncbi:MAG: NAD-dependent DNA ligase LigA, partial [Planctomycetes bacterium]|nr:NAD-dependent DNA ligase LigA [Planctomycetota bacterium]
SITRFFESQSGAELVRRLNVAGVNMRQPKGSGPATGGALDGKTVVITGTFQSMGRKEVQELVKRLGGKATGSVSKKTDLVVFGGAAGSKLDRAKKLGVKTIDEATFLRMIGR